MYSTRILNLLVVAVSLLLVAQASWVDLTLLGRHEEVAEIEERAGSSATPTGDAASQAASTQAATTAATTTSPPATTTSAVVKTTSTTPVVTSTTPVVSSTPTSTVAPVTTPSTSASPSATDADTTTSTPTTSQQPLTTVVVVTMTNSDGVPTTVTTATTSTPSASAAADSTSSSSGMPQSTKNTIIGVVVGVGGAIVLAGLALIAWRIWGRKKGQEESDGLMSYSGGPEKNEVGTSAVGSGRSPFQSTLESYHAPTQVNTASNF